MRRAPEAPGCGSRLFGRHPRRPRALHLLQARRVRELPVRPALRPPNVQAAQRPGAAGHGVRQGIAGVAGRQGGGVVGARAAVSQTLRRRRQPRGLLHSRHDPFLLPWQPQRRRRSSREGGGRRAPGGALLAGRHPVQRERRRQVGPRPARGGGALRALRRAGPRRCASRARALPPGRLRRAPRPGRGPPPPRRRQRPRALPRARRRGGQRGLPLRVPPHRRRRRRRRWRQHQPPPLRLRMEPAGSGAPHGEPVHVGLVGVARRAGVRQEARRGGHRRRRRRGRAPAVLPHAVRAQGDAAARVPALLGVRRGQLLLPRVPGPGLEARPQGPVRAHGPLARRRRRRRRRPPAVTRPNGQANM